MTDAQRPNDPTTQQSVLPIPCLLLLTDRTQLTPNWTLAQAVAPAITGGCNLVVLRERDLPPTPRSTVARFVCDGIKGRVPYVMAGDPGFALGAGADGVHLEGTDTPIEDARATIGPDRLLGVTVWSHEDAARAESGGADYVLIEYDWSNPDGVQNHLTRMIAGLAIPVMVGTDPPIDRITELRKAGAAGVAICSAAMSAYDRTAACRAYWNALIASDNRISP